jgi:hypothetical protein
MGASKEPDYHSYQRQPQFNLSNWNVCAYCENSLRSRPMALVGETFAGQVQTLRGRFMYMGERMFKP